MLSSIDIAKTQSCSTQVHVADVHVRVMNTVHLFEPSAVKSRLDHTGCPLVQTWYRWRLRSHSCRVEQEATLNFPLSTL